MVLNKNIKLILNYVIGPLVFCLLAFSIYRQLHRQPNWRESLYQLKDVFTGPAMWRMLAAMGLMLCNWGLEARKWQLAIRKVQPISFLQCWKAVFSGLTLAFFTPNRIGEYLGRVLYIRKGKRIQAISVTLVCSMAQLLVTWTAGIAGLFLVRSWLAHSDPSHTTRLFWMNAVLYGVSGAAVILTLLYFRLAWMVKWIEKIPRIERLISYIRVLEHFNATILLRILSLSVIRYGVFIAQYYLLFTAFAVQLNPGQVFGSISVVFVVLSIVPSIAIITDLVVRWETSIEIVQLFSSNLAGILAASLAIWIINLVIPALIGSLLILGIKIFNNKNKPDT